MIFLTRLDGKQFMLNEQMIEIVSETPDTVIVLSNGHSYIVRESMQELSTKISEYNRQRRRAVLHRQNDSDGSLT
ncbi:MAG: flagellar FlbD family protein [Oscillospiraceae bacterium]|nr:flagellar FlbD family protein [Oscillospiraceae bacterium]